MERSLQSPGSGLGGQLDYRRKVSRGERGAGTEGAERAAERFGERFRQRAGSVADRALGDSLTLEAAPVVEALLEGLRAAGRADGSALELREALTLTRLLGRRAAELGTSPAGILALAPSIVEAIAPDAPGCEPLQSDLAAIALEGYLALREERLADDAARRLADAIAVIELAPRCIVVVPSGVQHDDELERVFDELGRRLLARDARACVVHLADLREPDRERARRVFGLHATCLMLGAVCIFTSADEGWREAAREAGIDVGQLRFESDFGVGLAAALEACGLELRPRDGFGAVLRRLVAARR